MLSTQPHRGDIMVIIWYKQLVSPRGTTLLSKARGHNVVPTGLSTDFTLSFYHNFEPMALYIFIWGIAVFYLVRTLIC